MKEFSDLFASLRKDLDALRVFLEAHPDAVGTLAVDDYFLLLDVMRVYEYHV